MRPRGPFSTAPAYVNGVKSTKSLSQPIAKLLSGRPQDGDVTARHDSGLLDQTSTLFGLWYEQRM